MIYPETKLNVGDNSGAKLVKCVKVLKFSNKKHSNFIWILIIEEFSDQKLIIKITIKYNII